MKGTVSIPQAVSTVATKRNCTNFILVNPKVSIPQAVSTVATNPVRYATLLDSHRFNTASGKYCCN